MKVIIAGTRNLPITVDDLDRYIKESGFQVSTVFSGHSGNVDMCAEEWADEKGIPKKLFPAQWGKFGKAAGPIRNRQMAAEAQALIVLWDGNSAGTQDMLLQAHRHGLLVKCFIGQS